MRIQLVGKPFQYPGKTLWEIVSNLKNFGVGRLVKNTKYDSFKEPCYFKIVRVQPLPPGKSEYEDRGVTVWAEEVFRGKKLEVAETEEANLPCFELVPKHEEEKLTSVKVDLESIKKTYYKYTEWPPLFQRLWEAEHLKIHQVAKPIPRLQTVVPTTDKEGMKISEEATYGPLKSDFVQTPAPVEELLKEVVQLQKHVVMRSS